MRRGTALALLTLCACNPQPQRGAAATPASRVSPTSRPSIPPLDITAVGTARKPITIEGRTPSNRTEYVITALRDVIHQERGVFAGTLYTVGATFYASNGKRVTASSPRAYVDQGDRQRTVTMLGGVIATTSDGQTLHCRQLVYRLGDETLHGDGDVVITGRNGRMTGNHFDSDTSFTNVSMR